MRASKLLILILKIKLAVIVILTVSFPNSFLTAQNMKPDISILEAFESAEFTDSNTNFRLNYRFYNPLEAKTDNDESSLKNDIASSNRDSKKYPIIIFLHGAGERGDGNIKQLIWGSKELLKTAKTPGKEAFLLFPQCPENTRWVDVNWDDQISHSTPSTISDPLAAVWSLVHKMKEEYPIDESRIYVIGLSMGGYGTWDLLQRFPNEIAAAVPICGWGNPDTATKLLTTPIWAFHGAADNVVPVSRSQNIVRAIQERGGKLVRYTEYPYVGHNSWSPTLATNELWDWLFAQ